MSEEREGRASVVAGSKVTRARRFEHLCPAHGWETCGVGTASAELHACGKAELPWPRVPFKAETREVFLP